MNNTYNSQLTNNNDIYNETYWGQFLAHNNNPREEIIQNRNRFIIEYEITKHKEIPDLYMKKICDDSEGLTKNDKDMSLDHMEHYMNKYGDYVLIFSKYVNDDEKEIALGCGFKEIYPLYDLSQNTYMRVINTRTTLNKHRKYFTKFMKSDILNKTQLIE